jgi:hypothetical protein
MTYPNDSDGESLCRIAANGSDMAKRMRIDFHVAVENERAAMSVAAVASQKDYDCSVYHSPACGGWTCECSKLMIPDYHEILAIQGELNKISQPFGGRWDGWGTFGIANAPPGYNSADTDPKDTAR